MTDTFSAATRHTDTGPVLTIRGELDSTTAPQVIAEVRNLTMTSGQRLLIDLTELSFCDSSGIAALLAARNTTHSANATIALHGVPAQVTRTLNLLGLAALIPTTTA